MKKTAIFLVLFIAIISVSHSQFCVLKLYEREVPEIPIPEDSEIWDTTDRIRVWNIKDPDIAVYLPPKETTTKQAVVICPGGGYKLLSYNWEGIDVAKWLNSKGIAAIVLKYRLPTTSNGIVSTVSPIADAKRAVRMVRYYADKWSIDKDQIGIMGFSAGGHLASTLMTQFDYGLKDTGEEFGPISCRPDFVILLYPVISMFEPYVHKGSREYLLGKDPDEEVLKRYSAHLNIREDTPPVFLVHASDDKAVPPGNSIILFEALIVKNIPTEMHIYPYGGHGFSLGLDHHDLNSWTDRCIGWLKWLQSKDK